MKTILNELGVKDRRSAIKWCKYNGVEIFKDEGTKMLYALNEQYVAAKERATTRVLSYDAVKGNKTIAKYNPVSKYEEEILSRLLNRINNVV